MTIQGVSVKIFYTGKGTTNGSRTLLVTAVNSSTTSYSNVQCDVSMFGNVISLGSSFSGRRFNIPAEKSQPLMYIETYPSNTSSAGTLTVSAVLTFPGGEIVTADKYINETAAPESYVDATIDYAGGSGGASDYTVYLGDNFDCHIEGTNTRTHEIVLIPASGGIQMGGYFFTNQNFITLKSGIVCDKTSSSSSRPYADAEVLFDPALVGPTIPNSTKTDRYFMLCFAKQGSEYVGGCLIRPGDNQSFTMTMPFDVGQPTVTVNSIVDANGYKNTYGAYVATKSSIKVSLRATAAYGASIKQIEIGLTPANAGNSELLYTITPEAGTDNYTVSLGVPVNSGQKRIRIAVRDSRNIYLLGGYDSDPFTVVPYVFPTLTFQANRWDTVNNQENDGSNIVRLDGEGTVPNINGKTVAGNKLQFKWRLKGNTAWTTAATFTFTGPNVTKIQNVSNQSVDNQYEYQAILTDAFGVTVTSESSVGKAKPVLEFNASGLGMGIGTVAPETGLDVGMQTNFKGTAEDGYSRIQITDPDGSESVILANLSGSTLQLLVNALGSYDKALVGSHIFMQNNKSIGGLTTSGAQTPILKMNTSNLLEFTWPSGGVRGRVGKQIWEGNASPGSTITVPELPYYNVFVIYDAGSHSGIAVRTTFGAASWIWGLTHQPLTDNIWLKSFGALVNSNDPTKLELTFFVHNDLRNNYIYNGESLRGIRGLL